MTKKVITIPIEHKVLAVIDNFHCDLPEIELGKNLSICCIDTLPKEEKDTFSGQETQYNHFSHNYENAEARQGTFNFVAYKSAVGEVFHRTIERGNYVLRWHIKERVREPLREHYDFLLHPEREFATVLSALRILKAGMIGLYPEEQFLIELPIPKEFTRATFRSHNGYQLSDPAEFEPYSLLSEDIETLKQLVSAIRSIKQPGLLTALSRLDNQYSRAYIADRLIDAVIALEALYAGDNTTEIALRVGLRVSAHLGGSDADQRERFFNLFNLAYNLRSRLVHGSIYNTREIHDEVKKKDWKSNDAFMDALDNMLRQSLRYILINVKDRKLKTALHEPLDKAIRRGEAFSWDALS